MVKKINLTIISGILILLVLSQIIISFFVEPEIFWVLGSMHYLSLGLFLIFFILAQRVSIRGVFALILFYQMFLVFALFTFFIVVYNSPLGFEPVDEKLYHSLGQELRHKGFLASLTYLNKNLDISDIGFPLLVKYIYSLGGNGIFNMKIMNILIHVTTCGFLLKIGHLLFSEKKISKNAVILYGFSPMSIFFNASGFKEPLFTLIVVLSFYLLYKAFLEKKSLYFIFGLIALLTTGAFRITFPMFIFFSFCFYFLTNVSGKYRLVLRATFLCFGLILGAFLFQIFQDELQAKMAVDSQLVVADRLGRVPRFIDHIIMAISGIIGPIPTFLYIRKEELNLLQASGNFIKLFFSSFFILASYFVIKERTKEFYPFLLFILINVVMLTLTSLSLLHRFHYPFTPFFFLMSAYGMSIFSKRKIRGSVKFSYAFLLFVLIIGYNLR